MIENARTGLCWRMFMANPEIDPMLKAIGWQSTTLRRPPNPPPPAAAATIPQSHGTPQTPAKLVPK